MNPDWFDRHGCGWWVIILVNQLAHQLMYLGLNRLDNHILPEQFRAALEPLADGLALQHEIVGDGGGDDRIVLYVYAVW